MKFESHPEMASATHRPTATGTSLSSTPGERVDSLVVNRAGAQTHVVMVHISVCMHGDESNDWCARFVCCERWW